VTSATRRRDDWRALTARIGIPESLDVHDALIRAWSEPHRRYHTLAHLDDCLARLDAARADVDEADEVELALWFHDAVYKTRSKTNEEESASMARSFLDRAGAAPALGAAVREHILATRHDGRPERAASKWVVDIDLAVLGSERDVYDRFERDVRREYWWVPGPLFRKKRAEILRSFLDRPEIYETDRFRSELEQPARANLARALDALRP
jgi:predicted metal-dependent HD superfamily phosphohydrolase